MPQQNYSCLHASSALNLSSVSRYRIPDVLLCSVPVNATDKVLKSVPLAVIEIWSPEDRMPRQTGAF